MSWNQLAQVGIYDRVLSGICDLCSVCTDIVRWKTDYQICPWRHRSEYICGLGIWYRPNAIIVWTFAVGWLVY